MTAINRLYRTVLSVAAMLALATTAALGQAAHRQPADEGGEPIERIAAFDLPDLYTIPSEAQAHIARGDQLLGGEDYRGARKAYEAAIEIIRDENGFPAVPLKRLANAYYFEGLNRAAVRTLDRLADEAAEVGDVATQAWSQADAAWVLTLDCNQVGPVECPGGPLVLKQRLDKLRRLLASPYLPDEVRADIIEKRCGGDCRLVRVAEGQ